MTSKKEQRQQAFSGWIQWVSLAIFLGVSLLLSRVTGNIYVPPLVGAAVAIVVSRNLIRMSIRRGERSITK